MNTKKSLEEFISDIKRCLESEDYENAKKILIDALEFFPNQPSLLINLGNIYKCFGDYEEEVDQLRQFKNKITFVLFTKL